MVITRYENQPSAKTFKNKLERQNVRVYTHRYTKGYPTDVDTIVSDEGYGANEYIHTSKPIVVVTGPRPYSGKLATCLSQIYHEYHHGVHAGYAKMAVEKLKALSGCEVHMTHIPTPGDEAGLRKLKINLTSDPDFATKRLFGS